MDKLTKTEQQPLIKGCFHPHDAKEILSSLFHNKMQFHSMASFSIRERTGEDVSFHKQRIVELAKSLDQILAVIHLAKTEGLYLNISCDVKIILTENPD